jgi:hypothetical protein
LKNGRPDRSSSTDSYGLKLRPAAHPGGRARPFG